MTTPYAGEEPQKPAPKTLGPRADEGRMDDDELESILGNLLGQATEFVDGVLSPDRIQAADYYDRKPFGNEEPGRSQIIMPEVANAVQGIMPEFMRVFTGPKHYLEFTPTREGTTEIAEQATDYVRFVIEQDNPGFRLIHDSVWDGLVKRTGILKWGWEDYCEEFYALKGLTESQVAQLQSEEGVTVAEVEEDGTTIENPSEEELQAWQQAAQQAAQSQQPPPPPPQAREVPAFKLEAVYKTPTGKACVWALPPEELLITRGTRDVQKAPYLGHRMIKTRGELLAMGIPKEEIEQYGGTSGWHKTVNLEAGQREVDGVTVSNPAPTGEAGDEHDYFEHYVWIDFNGDGVQELRLICAIGSQGTHVVKNKMIGMRPFVVWSPYPKPHALVGNSVADKTMDLQKINSALVRGGADSLSASIFPRTAYQENMVSGADVNNTEIGAGIRTKGRPADVLHSFTHNFAGKEIFSFLQFFQQEKEFRTGVRNGAAGLDVDALQSTEANAAAETLDSHKAQIEYVCRVYAEECLKPLFRGLLKLLIENQPAARIVRLRGKFVTIDPRAWDADMDVQINVALGRQDQRKLSILLGVKADQDAILQMFGPNAPMTSLKQAYNIRIDILRLQGIMDVDRYYTDPSNWTPPPPQPSPEQAIAQAEMEINKLKVMSDLAQKHEELKLKQQEISQKYAIEQLKLQQEPQIAQQEQAARAVADKAAIDAQRAGDIEELHAKTALKLKEMEMELVMFREKLTAEIAQAREEARIKAAAAIQVAREKPAPQGGSE